ncbi:MAG: phospholipid carrier-dependent glycosyltransferase [Moorea sp. SIO4E2]|uniref:phospholipid carrier-dependent glycosyltransferase n=1 Tax=Moorena sp. SIO4E2 TaxID=2607826 RepID=UPI0013BD35D3|nr:phospholipid carrier-dependent glycosyltransferase [Moorena sp. SIO4E2]NEQ10061.1 phospholipid carrier-dependent glycosyltransferase [Moorena sp. SIO4E2]
MKRRFRDPLILGLIWLGSGFCDRIWFALDHSVPAWDQADYLTGSLNYWQALQHPQWFSGEWWSSFWAISSKVPPLTYIIAAMVQQMFGTGPELATIALVLCSGVLIASVYGLGLVLFNRRVGLWAAGLVVLLPGLYRYRLEFLLDYPLTTVVSLCFWSLTVWWSLGRAKTPLSRTTVRQGWLWGLGFGLCLGLALLVKQTALFFLFVPIAWAGVRVLWQRQWQRLAQLIGGLLVSVLLFGPWYRINWLLILTSGKRATIDSAIAEGDPALNTLDAWVYYWKILPYLISWPLLLIPIVGLLIYGLKYGLKQSAIAKPNNLPSPHPPIWSLTWLGVFIVGGYLLCSLNINKDARYILPLVPVLSVFLAYGLTCWTNRWGKPMRWSTVGLATVLMMLNLFPLGGRGLTQLLSPRVQHLPYLGQPWPHPKVIAEIIKTQPYLRSNLGVLPSTPDINQHNFNYYGALANFQVYGRQVGTQAKQVKQDMRSLSWFLTKTGAQGSIPESQAAIVQAVEQGSEFELHQTWELPDTSQLKLYHKRQPPIAVKPLSIKPAGDQSSIKPTSFNGNGSLSTTLTSSPRVKLEQVTIPETSPAGVPVPVTYQWTGSWEQLKSGIVILTWQPVDLKVGKLFAKRGLLAKVNKLKVGKLFAKRGLLAKVDPLFAKRGLLAKVGQLFAKRGLLAKVGQLFAKRGLLAKVGQLFAKRGLLAKVNKLKVVRVAWPFGQGSTDTNLEPNNLQPSTDTNLQPSTDTNLQPNNLQPSTDTNLQPSTQTNLQPSTDTNLQPSTQTNLQPNNLQPTFRERQRRTTHRWLHDHGIAMGELHSSQLPPANSQFQVIERMAMFPPADIPAGSYTLKATYLNRQTGETYPIQVPTVTLTIDPAASPIPAPELDLITQMRILSTNLPKGLNGLEPVFEETARINQYDPIQDYLEQADLALSYRLESEPNNLDLAYALALSRVLQQDVEGAIAALKRVTQLDPQNPYAHAYLAFVYLYDWDGKDGEKALKPALKINRTIPELQALSGIAALMQGNVFKAWSVIQGLDLESDR